MSFLLSLLNSTKQHRRQASWSETEGRRAGWGRLHPEQVSITMQTVLQPAPSALKCYLCGHEKDLTVYNRTSKSLWDCLKHSEMSLLSLIMLCLDVSHSSLHFFVCHAVIFLMRPETLVGPHAKDEKTRGPTAFNWTRTQFWIWLLNLERHGDYVQV